MRSILLSALVVLSLAALLLWPALYNGYVLIYPDSAIYVALSFAPHEYPPRSLTYPLLLYPLHMDLTLWTVIAAQCLAAAWVLHETVVSLVRRRPMLWLAGLGAALAALTGLPWTADQIMPDIFSGLVALALAVTIACGERLSTIRQLMLLAIAALGVALHTSHGAIAVAVLLGAALTVRWTRIPLRRLVTPSLATSGGIVLALGVHLAITGHAYYGQGGAQFLFGRLVRDGIVADYLNQVCPRPELSLCAMKDRLPENNDQYLWFEREAFLALGGWIPTPQLETIVVDSIARMPGRHLAAVALDTLEQLVDVGMGNSLKRQSSDAIRILEIAFPGDAAALHASRQERFELLPVFERLDPIQRVVQLAALAALPLLAMALARRGLRRPAGFGLLIFIALLANAFVCGVFSGGNSRYQNRIAWIAVVAVAGLAAAGRRGEWPAERYSPARNNGMV